LQEIKSVRNTIFPAVWAQRFPEPEELADHYREHYPTLRRFPKNRNGTYFGRLVAYPMGSSRDDGAFDQLTDLIKKLRAESSVKAGGKRARRLSSRYEVNIWKPGDLPTGMGFPCMAHMSFHLVNGALHLLAQYRNQYLIERAYGNYLGLAELQTYIAAAAGLTPGELMILASHASLDTHGKVGISAIRDALQRCPPGEPGH
jgi:thymidylate synthase